MLSWDSLRDQLINKMMSWIVRSGEEDKLPTRAPVQLLSWLGSHASSLDLLFPVGSLTITAS